MTETERQAAREMSRAWAERNADVNARRHAEQADALASLLPGSHRVGATTVDVLVGNLRRAAAER